jgi:hypothetical protein
MGLWNKDLGNLVNFFIPGPCLSVCCCLGAGNVQAAYNDMLLRTSGTCEDVETIASFAPGVAMETPAAKETGMTM